MSNRENIRLIARSPFCEPDLDTEMTPLPHFVLGRTLFDKERHTISAKICC